MPLLRNFLPVPMAAPETRALKILRCAIIATSLSITVSIAALAPLRAAIGIGAGAVVAGLLLALAALVPVYLIVKARADEAHLAAMLAETER
jgi:hypothetical protein